MDEDNYGASPVAPDEEDDLLGGLLHKLNGITTTDPEELVRQWSQIMSVPPEEAKFFLESCNYDLGAAIGFYLEAHTREPASGSSGPAPSKRSGAFKAEASSDDDAEMDLQAALAASAKEAGLPAPSPFSSPFAFGSAAAAPPPQLFSTASAAFAGGFAAMGGPTASFAAPAPIAPAQASSAPPAAPPSSSSSSMDEL